MSIPPPMGLIAELTHRCPLQCAYCSNPLQMDAPKSELSTADWLRVLDEAAAIGVLQVHFSGGEPMARRDLPQLVGHANKAGLYTNIITSGVLLTDEAMATLLDAGIDHIQLSFQDSTAEGGDRIGGYRGGHAKKLEAARRIREAGLPLTANFVIHRQNIERVEDMIALGETLGAERMEIAHTQYYGWALLNRNALGAIVFFVVFGNLLGVAWLTMDAVNVALAEIALGAGVTGILLIVARARLKASADEQVLPATGVAPSGARAR